MLKVAPEATTADPRIEIRSLIGADGIVMISFETRCSGTVTRVISLLTQLTLGPPLSAVVSRWRTHSWLAAAICGPGSTDDISIVAIPEDIIRISGQYTAVYRTMPPPYFVAATSDSPVSLGQGLPSPVRKVYELPKKGGEGRGLVPQLLCAAGGPGSGKEELLSQPPD